MQILICNLILIFLNFIGVISPLILMAKTQQAAYGWLLYFSIPIGITTSIISLLIFNILNVFHKKIYLNLSITIIIIAIILSLANKGMVFF